MDMLSSPPDQPVEPFSVKGAPGCNTVRCTPTASIIVQSDVVEVCTLDEDRVLQSASLGAPCKQGESSPSAEISAGDNLVTAGATNGPETFGQTSCQDDAGTKSDLPIGNTKEDRDHTNELSRPSHPLRRYNKLPQIAATPALKSTAPGDPQTKRNVVADPEDDKNAQHLQTAVHHMASQGTSSGPLNKKLYKALKGAPGLPKFCPNSEVFRLINEKSVQEELKRHHHFLRSKKESISKSSQKDHNRVLSFPGRAIKASRSFASGVLAFTGEGNSERIASQARKICGNRPAGATGDKPPTFRKIFAILVMIEMPLKIKRFLKDGICDHDLPLSGCWVGNQFKISRRQTPGTLANSGKLTKEKPLRCFRGWKSNQKEMFARTNWAMVAPFFARGDHTDDRPIRHRPLESQVALPFIKWDPVEPCGAFGQVFKVEIDEEYHSFSKERNQSKYFAVKRLSSKSKSALENETTMLKLLSAFSHEHLISLLTTFEQNGSYHLVFHWGESDLLSYWSKTCPRPIVEERSTRWLARQCSGIADGLSFIHKALDTTERSPFRHLESFRGQLERENAGTKTQVNLAYETKLVGHHGDIKAQNIILFPGKPDEPTLKIADFGLAGFKSSWVGSAGHTPMYAPPEFAIPNTIIDYRSCDIWALGCLYLECITWFLGGWEMLQSFADERKFDDLSDLGAFYATQVDEQTGATRATIKGCVLQCIQTLQKHPLCNHFFDNFLRFIERRMLVMEIDEKLRVQNYRYDCLQVKDYLVNKVALQNPI